MKSLLAVAACLSSTFLYGASDTYSKGRLVRFYDTFLCEEKDDLFSAGLTSSCSAINPNNGGNHFFPPPNPSPPPFRMGLVPVVLVNNSGFPDSEVYVLVTGTDPSNGNQAWGNINTTTGVVTVQDVMNGDNGSTFSVLLSNLPLGSTGRVFYMPPINSSLFWFSMQQSLDMPVSGLAIVQPSFTNPSDANYFKNFDVFEFAYVSGGNPPVNADATAVSFFSIPLYGYLAGATSTSNTTGLYQPRCHIMAQAASVINSNSHGAENIQWNNLFLKSGSNILRLVSTGKAMAASLFDANYLDNAAAYGYSYISDIWNGPSSFYKTNMLKLTASVTFPASAVYNYTGQVSGGNTFVFTSSNGGPMVTFVAPTTAPTPTGTTSFFIFSDINLVVTSPPYPTAGSAADVISRLFEQAVIAGILPIPTADTLSLSYIQSKTPYYMINNLLTPPGPTTGPWYDLYSKALHSLGSIYTSGFDETLWPNVLLGGPFVDGMTYLGITIGNVTSSCSN